jgi:hypothetical protein
MSREWHSNWQLMNGILFVKVNTNSIKISLLLTAVTHFKIFNPVTYFLSVQVTLCCFLGSKLFVLFVFLPSFLYLYITGVPAQFFQSLGHFF